MRPVHTLVLLAVALASHAARADQITITDGRCVATPLAGVLSYATNYAGYSSSANAELLLDDAKARALLGTSSGASAELMTNLSSVLKTTGPVHALKMMESREALQKTPGDPNHIDSLVRFTMRPLNFDSGTDVFPTFWVRCKVTGLSQSRARQECHTLTSQDLSEYGRPGEVPRMFAVSGFDSTLDIESPSAKCAPGQTRIDYQMQLTTREDQINAIRDRAPFPKNLLFNVMPHRDFFYFYYKDFLEGWLRPLKPGQ
jgi:hypothetical protein